MNLSYIAHTRPTKDPHDLSEHLFKVGKLAKDYASTFHSDAWGYVTGILHDLGKYHQEFQDYLRNTSTEEAHLETEDGRTGGKRQNGGDHSTAGALHAKKLYGELYPLLAYSIAGHHGGLANWTDNLALRLDKPEKTQRYQACLTAPIPIEILKPQANLTCLPAPLLKSIPENSLALSLWIRMLFSCLVDADFLDTEAYMDGQKAKTRQSVISISCLKDRLDQGMEAFTQMDFDKPINRIRRRILNDCRVAALKDPGLFSLEVPTGGGKTLASTAFALDHALRHSKQRIIYVIPYTSIVEQTTAVLRKHLGDDAVIEHHSSVDPVMENNRNRLASENWDAPVVVTTNVQFFESLFAAKTSRCRKLHNIVNSVVILDEVQQLPYEFRIPIEHALDLLVSDYGVSVALCSATQPDLKLKSPITSIVTVKDLHATMQRVVFHLPYKMGGQRVKMTQPELAQKLTQHENVLCIVNTRKECQTLFQTMQQEIPTDSQDGLIHLSALMCGAHRSEVIARIKKRLQENKPTQVISTSLVEAGVDLDFQVVYRAMAGLDSIVQAAGRCNREGKAKLGHVHIFEPEKRPFLGLQKWGYQITETIFSLIEQGALSDDLTDPAVIAKYFELMRSECKDILDDKNIVDDLGFGPKYTRRQTDPHFNFRDAADKFKLIEDDYSFPVIVPYGDEKKWEPQIASIRAVGPTRQAMRSLQRYTVTIPPRDHARLLKQKSLEEIYTGIFVLADKNLYDPTLGLLTDIDPASVLTPESLYVGF